MWFFIGPFNTFVSMLYGIQKLSCFECLMEIVWVKDDGYLECIKVECFWASWIALLN